MKNVLFCKNDILEASSTYSMQLPYRKPGKFALTPHDPHISQQRYDKLVQKVARLKASIPSAAAEVSRLAEMGDFSENAEYQMAKWKLRGIHSALLHLEYEINHAQIIEVPRASSSTIDLGDTVVLSIQGKERTYTILGANEADPARSIISQHSPLGAAILGRNIGEKTRYKVRGEDVEVTIVRKK